MNQRAIQPPRRIDLYGVTVGIILIMAFEATTIGWPGDDWGEDLDEDPFFSSGYIISHRGDMRERPENTFSALVFAYEHGVRVIELDVQITQDMVPVVLHDVSLDRTTNGSGLVNETPWSVIEHLDAGSHFSEAYAGERIPRLEDVFHWLSEHNELVLWVHLRFKQGDEVVSALIDECRVSSQVVVQVDVGEYDRLGYYDTCLGRACIVKVPLLPFVMAAIADCSSHNVQFMTVMDVLASKTLYEIASSNGIRLMLTRNFDADREHIASRLADGAWAYIIDSARDAGALQNVIGTEG